MHPRELRFALPKHKPVNYLITSISFFIHPENLFVTSIQPIPTFYKKIPNGSKKMLEQQQVSGICVHVWKLPVCIPLSLLLSSFDFQIICTLLWRFIPFQKTNTSSLVDLGDSFRQMTSKKMQMQQTYQTSMAIHVLMDVQDSILMVLTNPHQNQYVSRFSILQKAKTQKIVARTISAGDFKPNPSKPNSIFSRVG